MAHKKTTEVEFTTDFIEIYKKHPTLWKIKSPEYSNRILKDKGYGALLDVYHQHGVEPADVGVVKKKITALRAAFRRELKKVKTQKSGIGADEGEEYHPTLWYYHLLLFTADNEEMRPATENADSGNDGAEGDEDIDVENTLPVHDELRQETTNEPKRKKKTETKTKTSDILQKAYDTLNRADDECDIFGTMVAGKLRKMNEMQRLFCENLINNCLFKGAMEQLTEHTTLTTRPEPEMPPWKWNMQSPRQPAHQQRSYSASTLGSPFNVNSILERGASEHEGSPRFYPLLPMHGSPLSTSSVITSSDSSRATSAAQYFSQYGDQDSTQNEMPNNSE